MFVPPSLYVEALTPYGDGTGGGALGGDEVMRVRPSGWDQCP